MIRLFAIIYILGFMLTACGRYGNPVPPSALAPTAPSKVKASVSSEGALVSWNLPELDRRGKRLKEIETIQVYRRKMPSVVGELAGTESAEPWKLLKEVEVKNFVSEKDNSTNPLGPVAKQSKVGSLTGSVLDSDIESGASYQYYVVATNQGGVSGIPSDIIQVNLRGEGEVLIIPNKKGL
jgi:hypothetical protein